MIFITLSPDPEIRGSKDVDPVPFAASGLICWGGPVSKQCKRDIVDEYCATHCTG